MNSEIDWVKEENNPLCPKIYSSALHEFRDASWGIKQLYQTQVSMV